jgi:hypothetical protein
MLPSAAEKALVIVVAALLLSMGHEFQVTLDVTSTGSEVLAKRISVPEQADRPRPDGCIVCNAA